MLINSDIEHQAILTGRPIYFNCTFNYPEHTEEVSVKEYIEDDIEFSMKKIEFIQQKINMKLPSDLIESILNAEELFLQQYE